MDLFEDQVLRTPDQVAVVYEGEELTYAELNERANQLGRTLRKDYGVQPDNLVVMVTERSLEMIVGIYGILKAGGAYVPVSPDYPSERIEYILQDSQPKAVVVYDAQVETHYPVLDLSLASAYAMEGSNLSRVNESTDLAYVI